MDSRFLRALRTLDLEERILCGGSIVAIVGIALPWLSGEWLGGDPVTYNGFRFYTSFLGIAIFFLHAGILLLSILPLTGGPALVRRSLHEPMRLLASAQATILVLAALTVLTKVTFEFSRVEVRFGIYVTLIGSLVSSLYTFLRFQEQRRRDARAFFHHPEDAVSETQLQMEFPAAAPPPPSPPPPLPAEEHALHFIR